MSVDMGTVEIDLDLAYKGCSLASFSVDVPVRGHVVTNELVLGNTPYRARIEVEPLPDGLLEAAVKAGVEAFQTAFDMKIRETE